MRILSILVANFVLLSCTFGKESGESVQEPPKSSSVTRANKKAAGHDKSLDILTRYFEQADSVHREIWRVLAEVKLPVGKTPFGKVHRALMASENIKLSNKSQFSCDNYSVKRDVKGVEGFPQEAEVFEVCNRREGAKRLAKFQALNNRSVKVTFYSENLREVVGLGPTVVAKVYNCELKASESLQLEEVNCDNWNQDKSSSEMFGFTTYKYNKNKPAMISLKGKVFKDLTDVRSIEVSIPQQGKVKITETELYAPEEEPQVIAKPPPLPPKADDTDRYLKEKKVRGRGGETPPLVLPDNHGIPEIPPHGHEMIPLAPEQQVDPDVLQQQRGEQGHPESDQDPNPENDSQDTGEDYDLPVVDENGELRER